jgi:probable F420-dependent oxidoreductase
MLLGMRFAIALPQFYSDGEFDPAAFRGYLARAEQLGFESAWAMEQVLGSWRQLGPMETMTYAAACTERMRLGCVVFVSTLHNPVHLAKSLSTLDQLSRGRLEIGVGTGGKQRPFAAFGVDPDRYVARFTEGIELMKALWTEPRVSFDGEFWQLRNAAMEPKPFTKPHPPLWFGGAAPSAIRRAVRMGSGFFGAGSSPTARFAEQVQVLRKALAEAGRPAESFPVAKRVYIAIDDDAGRARARVNAALEQVYGQRVEAIEAAAITGTAAHCVRELRRVAEAGAELILFTPLFDQPEQMERLAASVISSWPQRYPVSGVRLTGDAGAGARGDHLLEDVHDPRICHAAPVRGQQAPGVGIAPVGPVLIGHGDGALGLRRVERPPAPVHVMLGEPGMEVGPPYGGVRAPG